MNAATSRVALFALSLAAGCSSEDTGPSQAHLDDVGRVRVLMATDPTVAAVQDVERVADGRPVEAGRRVRTGALPSAEEQLERARGLEVLSPQGRRYRRRLVRIYSDRVEALTAYAHVLERAAQDEDALVAALRAQSEVEMELLAVHQELDTVAPLSPNTEPPRPEADEPSTP